MWLTTFDTGYKPEHTGGKSTVENIKWLIGLMDRKYR